MNKYIQLNTEVDNLKNLKKNLTKNKFLDEKKELENIINLELIEVQKNIDLSNSEEISKIKDNIARIKILISQINVEYFLINRDYEEKINTYKFPDSVQYLNIKIHTTTGELNKLKKENTDLLQTISTHKKELNNFLIQKSRNEKLLNDKKIKITNNSEILAVIEKKNNILKNKNKLLDELEKKIQIKRDTILNNNNDFNIKVKELCNLKKK